MNGPVKDSQKVDLFIVNDFIIEDSHSACALKRAHMKESLASHEEAQRLQRMCRYLKVSEGLRFFLKWKLEFLWIYLTECYPFCSYHQLAILQLFLSFPKQIFILSFLVFHLSLETVSAELKAELDLFILTVIEVIWIFAHNEILI